MLPQKNNTAIWFVIFLILVLLVGNFVFTQYQFLKIQNSLIKDTSLPVSYLTKPSLLPTPISTPVPTVFPTTTPQPVQVFIHESPQPNSKITYIPLSGGSTQATDWVNVSGSQFTLNISDYGSKAYSIWDANLRVDNANGTTFVRLFDITHGIAVNGSEISISNTSSSTDVVSGSLSFWSGNNSYVVQIKSLNSSTAFIDSGRIKISY